MTTRSTTHCPIGRGTLYEVLIERYCMSLESVQTKRCGLAFLSGVTRALGVTSLHTSCFLNFKIKPGEITILGNSLLKVSERGRRPHKHTRSSMLF